MAKKIIIIGLVLLLAVAGAFGFRQLRKRAMVADIISDEAARDYRDSLAAATRMKVVVFQDGTVARFVSEDEDTFTCCIQDTFPTKKKGAHVELWSASDGKGIVYLKVPGSSPSYLEPDTVAAISLDLKYEDGCVPETYPCLGLKDGWYKIEMGGCAVYIEAGYVNWDAIDSF